MVNSMVATTDMLSVQLYYAAREHIVHLALQIVPGTTIKGLLEQPAVQEKIYGEELAACRVGIWNRIKTLDTVLFNLDRVEIYRPLVADPKEARRRRAEKK